MQDINSDLREDIKKERRAIMSKSILLKDNSRDVQWKATVDGNVVTYEWGKVGGTQQSDSKTYTVGKNVGKSNETTPEQQCLAEALVKARKKVEKGYEIVSGDLGSPIETTSDLTVTKPMKANDLHDHMKKIDTWDIVGYQWKLNGNRCKIDIDTGKMYSSSRKEITHLPEIGEAVAEACQPLLVRSSYPYKFVDGELYHHGMSFNAIQTLVRRVSGDTKYKKGDEIDTPEKFKEYKSRLQFYMFDIESSEMSEDRAKVMEDLNRRLNAGDERSNYRLIIVPTEWDKASKFNHYLKQYTGLGFEGVIIRLKGYPYECKRSLGLYKWKAFMDAEFKVVGYTPEKLDPDKLGAMVLELDSDPSVTFEATPKMTDEQKAEIWNNKEEYIGKLATVKFQNRDEKSNIPIFPVLLHFRDPDDMS